MGGNTKKAKGRAKQAVGAITGDKQLQREGKRDERVGSLDDATDAVHDKVDEVIEKVSHKK